MTFDRLIYIDRLKEAGVGEPVARAHADALREALLETVVTKADLKDAVEGLEKKIDTLDRKVDGRLHDLNTAVGTLDRKIEITSRDLVIKGAGGLIIIATLMIGLKLFG